MEILTEILENHTSPRNLLTEVFNAHVLAGQVSQLATIVTTAKSLLSGLRDGFDSSRVAMVR